MKRCPECRRDYYDDSLLYCLDDGTALLEGPGVSEPATEIFSSRSPGDVPTQQQIHTTNLTEQGRKTAVLEGKKERRPPAHLLLGTVAVLAAAGGVTAWFLTSRSSDPEPKQTRPIKVSRLTAHGQVGIPAISPDGKYVIYTVWEQGKGTLWLRQTSTNSAVPLLKPDNEDVGYGGRAFSPNGEMIYYVHMDKDNERGVLNEMPTLGGTPRKILTDIASGISFAPDGKTFAFFRSDDNQGAMHLMTASVDQPGERVLATRKGNDWFMGEPSWSPDGKLIACPAATDTGGFSVSIKGYDAETGEEKPVTTHKWRGSMTEVAWQGDGSGLLAAAATEGTSPSQIWHVSYPAGEVKQLTSDLNGYAYVSVTADSSALVTRQEDTTQRIWTSAIGEAPEKAKQVSNGKLDGQSGIAWTSDGRIVYTAVSGETQDLWIMNADGSAAKALSSDKSNEFTPCATADGRFIVFASDRDGGVSHLFRMNPDGSGIVQLTSGPAASGSPRCSPDSQTVAFGTFRTGTFTIWRVPVGGGEPVQVSERPINDCYFGDTATKLICLFSDETFKPPKQRGAIMSLETGDFEKVFDVPPRPRSYSVSPDGRHFAYSQPTSGTDNVWVVPVGGGPPKQLTHFKPDHANRAMFRFAWSHDSKRLAMARGDIATDVVLIKDFR